MKNSIKNIFILVSVFAFIFPFSIHAEENAVIALNSETRKDPEKVKSYFKNKYKGSDVKIKYNLPYRGATTYNLSSMNRDVQGDEGYVQNKENALDVIRNFINDENMFFDAIGKGFKKEFKVIGENRNKDNNLGFIVEWFIDGYKFEPEYESTFHVKSNGNVIGVRHMVNAEVDMAKAVKHIKAPKKITFEEAKEHVLTYRKSKVKSSWEHKKIDEESKFILKDFYLKEIIIKEPYVAFYIIYEYKEKIFLYKLNAFTGEVLIEDDIRVGNFDYDKYKDLYYK